MLKISEVESSAISEIEVVDNNVKIIFKSKITSV